MECIHRSTVTAGKARIRAQDLGTSVISEVRNSNPQAEAMYTGISQELAMRCSCLRRKKSALDEGIMKHLVNTADPKPTSNERRGSNNRQDNCWL